MDTWTKTCGPIPGRVILTHTQMPAGRMPVLHGVFAHAPQQRGVYLRHIMQRGVGHGHVDQVPQLLKFCSAPVMPMLSFSLPHLPKEPDYKRLTFWDLC